MFMCIFFYILFVHVVYDSSYGETNYGNLWLKWRRTKGRLGPIIELFGLSGEEQKVD